ncbi:glyoxylase-like metal-dependent hydrolase (beta-lactamase superfamily II) [Chitinivorax tropicus]|uniref:Glyoxylase-like metal-dependent hydrolase (Beta-lactamase superfamily II) n=1 Tax=Chitinivorax tropicus TaxID=714531 RepID=A0A840MKC3_9PROT|nr:MBL fold metallo-hydrolase [Chitinivorax tropicus]MBB5017016.1 glyoxylase-like metal-dependent hydrolase (beta-lactamase superfamily II) [Chitinivorax tropicus]
MAALIEPFYDPTTGTISYVVYDKPGGHALVIDPVLDFDAPGARIREHSVQAISQFLQTHQLQLEWILETHAHADHLSAAQWLKRHLGGRVAIGENIRTVQALFKPVFHLEESFAADGSPFDVLLRDNEVFRCGGLQVEVLAVPGHTPADVAYRIDDAVFVGDTLFMPDVGTARCDFPGGDARQLYRSIHRLLSLPDRTRLFMCHDYPPAGRAPAWQSSVAEQRQHNLHIGQGVDEDTFVARRTARDATLQPPTLLLPSIQVNIRAGHLPPVEANGRRYLKLPIGGA